MWVKDVADVGERIQSRGNTRRIKLEGLDTFMLQGFMLHGVLPSGLRELHG